MISQKGGVKMENIYEYQNNMYEQAVKNLKASLFDVIIAEEKNIEKLEPTKNNSSEKVNEQLYQQLVDGKKLLSSTVSIITELISNLEKLDANHTAISKIEEKTFAPVPTETKNQEIIDIEIQKPFLVKEEQENTVAQVEANPEEKEVVEKIPAMVEMAEQDLPEESTESESINTINDEFQENAKVDSPIETSSEKTKVIADVPTVVEVAVQKLPEKTKESEDSIVEKEPNLEATDKSLQSLSAKDTPAKKQFVKTTNTVTKAIIVRENQLGRLQNSQVQQEKIVKKLHALDGIEQFQKTKRQLEDSLTKDQNAIGKVVEEALAGNTTIDTERQIEDLMVKANVYYNAGETQKAQELYDQISKLNNIKKKETKGEVLVKSSTTPLAA